MKNYEMENAEGHAVPVETSVLMQDGADTPLLSPLTVTEAVTVKVPEGAVVFSVRSSGGALQVATFSNAGSFDKGYDLVGDGERLDIGCSRLSEIYLAPDSVDVDAHFHFKML